MPSELRSDTARANGAKSHGPKSEETRAISSQNALRHGFTACHTTMLKCENPDEFEETINQHFATYKPSDPAQEALVKEMISTRWRIRRLRIVETQLVNTEMIQNAPKVDQKFVEPDSVVHLAEAYRTLMDDSNALSLLSRYESRLFRIHDRAYRILRELQSAGLNGPEALSPESPLPVPSIEAEPASPPEPENKDDETNPAAQSMRLLPPRQTHHSKGTSSPRLPQAGRLHFSSTLTGLPAAKLLRRK